MKLALDARGVNWYNGTGIGTYSYNLFKNLIMDYNEHFFNLFWSGNNYKEFKYPNTSVTMASKKHQRFFENTYIPSFLNKYDFDIYHIPQNGIGLSKNINCKKIITIHDLIPYVLPETVGKGYLKRFLEEMPQIIESTDAILTVSNYSKKDILRFFPFFDEDKIFVTPLAADESFKPLNKDICKKNVQSRYNFSYPYILYIGGFSSRKNVFNLIKSFKDSISSLNKKINLVIVGSIKDEGKKILELIDKLNLSDFVIFTDFVENSYLPILYNGCECFVYPSNYEGFGLPPLEAMSCKAPVISSDITSIPEVVADCGMLINPNNQNLLSNAIVEMINNDSIRYELSEKGYKRSQSFSWKNTTSNTLKAYNSLFYKL